jgi:hypothetical protein
MRMRKSCGREEGSGFYGFNFSAEKKHHINFEISVQEFRTEP